MIQLKLKLDFRSDVPIYTQIVDQVQQSMQTGELKPGDQLPTVRQLAADLRVNFNTVARAYRILDEMRLISTQRGRGTYIWNETGESPPQQPNEDGLEELARDYLQNAAKLGFSVQEATDAVEEIIRSDREVARTDHENTRTK